MHFKTIVPIAALLIASVNGSSLKTRDNRDLANEVDHTKTAVAVTLAATIAEITFVLLSGLQGRDEDVGVYEKITKLQETEALLEENLDDIIAYIQSLDDKLEDFPATDRR